MTKRRTIILSLVVALVALLLGFACYFGAQHYLKNRIVFHIEDTLPDGEGKRAQVIILAGQSNASGCSRDEYLKKNVSSEKYAEYQKGYDNVYINYLSGENRSEEFVKCAPLQGEIAGGFGPELGLAEKLNELYPDEMFFIVKCAWGGSNLFKQWLSPSSKGKTGELYRQFVTYVETSIQYLKSKNYEVKIESMCWMQGESDALSVESSERYGEHLNNLITDIRENFSEYASEDGIAFVDAYIAPNPMYWVYYEGVNRGKDEVAALSAMNVLVDTISAGLDCSKEPEGAPDIAHYDSLSEIKLGHLFAEETAAFLDRFEK
ncbi:MAG: sialate O-acetylesterase [Clostridiales bacterium]|nr:sialate O-acetylesterase [Clostridiales bacterium]